MFVLGIYQVNRYLECRLYSVRDAEQPTYLPRQALPGSAEPHSRGPGLTNARGLRMHYQREGNVGLNTHLGDKTFLCCSTIGFLELVKTCLFSFK